MQLQLVIKNDKNNSSSSMQQLGDELIRRSKKPTKSWATSTRRYQEVFGSVPRVCSIAWNKLEATREAMRDGWLDTGDLMRADDEGYLWFRGRKKQIIVHDGSNICPQEVEEALLEHTALSGAAVVGVHDLLHGEDVRAYVSFREDAKRPTAQELIQFARARVGYKAPEEIVVLDEIPMTPTAKIDRVRLKAMAERDRAHP